MLDGTTYYYQVSAYKGSVYSSFSSEANATTSLAAPGGLSATASGSTSIGLTWADNSDSEEGYLIERRTGSEGFTEIASIGADLEAYTDLTVLDGTTYYYQVRAYQGSDHSDYSSEANATTSLAAPGGLSATASGSVSIGLSWTINSVSEEGFLIERRTGSEGFTEIASIGPDLTSYTDLTVLEGTTYYYQVRAYKGSVYSSFSPEANATTSLAAPSGLSATASGSVSIGLSWTINSVSEEGFLIERRTGSEGFTEIASIGPDLTSYTDLTVLDGTTYYYQVSAYKGSVYSSFSSEANATTSLAAPGGLSATASGSTSIGLTWADNSDSEEGYLIERRTGSEGFGQIASIGPDLEAYTDLTVLDGTTYYYQVRAYQGSDHSDYSSEANATTSLAAPGGLSATASGSVSIGLSWTINSVSEEGFLIERRTGSEGFTEIASIGPDLTSYSDLTVLEGTTYFYQVRAYKGSSYSVYSNEASTTADPAAPTSLTAFSEDEDIIRLDWTDVSTKETGYVIERAVTSGGSYSPVATLGADYTTYIDGGLTAGIEYFYRVQASGILGNSLYSNEASATPILITPGGLEATVLDEGSIQLTWTDSSNHETGYSIERSLSTNDEDFAQIQALPANFETYTDNSCAEGTAYFYRVQAIRLGGDSPYSNEASATTFPATPTDLTAVTVDSSSIQLTWTDNTLRETGYQILRSLITGSGFAVVATLPANSTSYLDEGLIDGKEYFYKVRAVAPGDVFSLESNEASAITDLSAPTNLTALALNKNTVELRWSNNSASETAYSIERSETFIGGYSVVASVAANTTSYKDKNLEDETEYFYRVRSIGIHGNSSYSNVASATTPLAVPDAPDSFIADATTTCAVALTWIDMSDNEDGFEIERSPFSTFGYKVLVVLPAEAEAYTDTSTRNNNTYYYRLRSINVAGRSDSATVSESVSYDLNGGIIASDQSICPMGDPELIRSQVDPSGGDNSWTYQWQSRISPAAFTNIPLATGLTYDPPEGMIETTEFQRVSTVACGSAISNTVTITPVDIEDPVFTICPADLDIDIERNLTYAQVTTVNPVFTDNCEVFLLTWTMNGDTVAASPVTGLNYLGTVRFPLGTTTVTYHAEDFSGNSAECLFSVNVKIKDPEILNVSIADDIMGIGDLITATITVANDGESVYTLVSGQIGGYSLQDLQRFNETTYFANFVITEGGNSYLPEQDIPVQNLVFTDGVTQSLPISDPHIPG